MTKRAGVLPDDLSAALADVSTSRGRLRYLRAGAGQPVVFLHTLRTQLEMYGCVLEHLDRDAVCAVAIDLPGHGHSEAPSVAYTLDYFSDAIADCLDAIGLPRATIVGESIGATIALELAARRDSRVDRVIAINPYDYGRCGGIRRSSLIANVLFTAILWPALGALVARGETRPILRAVMRGGVQNPDSLDPGLLEELYRSGKRPGHASGLRSLSREWRSFVRARDRYGRIDVPVTLVYGDADWSHPAERESNRRAIPGADLVTLERCGHFATLDQPEAIAALIAARLDGP